VAINTVLNVLKPITFILEGYPNAKTVYLTGSFINWEELKYKMTNINGIWTLTIPIYTGKHHYKFIIDGGWHTDPANPVVEDDGKGNLNSVLFVH
ncbi:MAG: glycogen-binding domain-containing protein, partial [Bacteroidota bacterium]|nr:glycogen-binding domain-containing protein [Bacteroidota bacterium]